MTTWEGLSRPATQIRNKGICVRYSISSYCWQLRTAEQYAQIAFLQFPLREWSRDSATM
jgi:hypothetical protein